MFIVCFGFVIFNANNLGEALQYFGAMFGAGSVPFVSTEFTYYLGSFGLILLLSIAGSTPLSMILTKKFSGIKNGMGERILNLAEPIISVILLLLVTAYLVDGSFNPFLYFRF